MTTVKLQFSILLFVIGLSAPYSAVGEGAVFDPTTNTVNNWRKEALENLRIKDKDDNERAVSEQDFTVNGKSLRCISMNNYWCVKALGWKWDGQIALDDAKHAAFESAIMSARAAARDLRTKYITRGYKSAYAIMTQYAPPNDCIGDILNPDKSCKYGKNPTEKYSQWIIRGITTDIRQDLNLFDSAGLATSNLRVVLKNMARVEVGPFTAAESTIDAGIRLESPVNRIVLRLTDWPPGY